MYYEVKCEIWWGRRLIHACIDYSTQN